MIAEEALEPLLRNLPKFFDTSSLADGTIRCGQKEIQIHKLLLCAQSGYFMRMFNGDWKESEGPVSLQDDDTCAVEAMIEFMYTFDYDSSGRGENSSSPMVFSVRVYSIADKYDVQALKKQAKQKFKKAIEVCWDMDDFPDAVAQVYSSTPASDQGLREVVSAIAVKNIDRLLSKQNFRDVLQETTGFASDLVKGLARGKTEKQRAYSCPSCDKIWSYTTLSNNAYYHCVHCGYQSSDWASREI